jgi:hypothetical protein
VPRVPRLIVPVDLDILAFEIRLFLKKSIWQPRLKHIFIFFLACISLFTAGLLGLSSFLCFLLIEVVILALDVNIVLHALLQQASFI